MNESQLGKPQLHLELPPNPTSVGLARRLIEEKISGLSLRDRENLSILMCDLAAGSLAEGTEPVVLDIWKVVGGVRVEEHASHIDETLDALATRLLDRLAAQWEVDEDLAWFFLEVPASLADEDDLALFESAAAGDGRSVEVLILRYKPFALSLTRGYRGSAVTADDIEQVALVALTKAIERFDTNRGVRFTSFAAPTIRGELKKWLRSSAWAVRVPRGVQELNLEAKRVMTELSQEIGHEPSIAELSTAMDTESAQIEEALAAPMSMQALLGDASDERQGGKSLDAFPSTADTAGVAVEHSDLAAAIGRLPNRERRLLHLRFFEDLTQQEIAEELGVSQMQISRLLTAALAELRSGL